MSESSLQTDISHDTRTTDSGHLASTSIPLAIVPAYKHLKESKDISANIPELPSHRFQYSLWHELRGFILKGTDLKAPRVRAGPEEKERAFYQLKNEDNVNIHHDLHGKTRTIHKRTTENWEEAKSASFCYQDMNDRYQKNSLFLVLSRLASVEQLTLVDNCIRNLNKYSFPKCEVLNVNKNYMSSFKHLPSIPRIKVLIMEDNDVDTFYGLNRLSSVEDLYLHGNPISFLINYRPRVFQMLPQLKTLDGIPRLQSDLEFDTEYGDDDLRAEGMNNGSCTIL